MESAYLPAPSAPLLWAWASAPGNTSPDATPLVNEVRKYTVNLSSHLAKWQFHFPSHLLPSGLGAGAKAWLAHLSMQVMGEDEEENNLEVRETRLFMVKLPVALDPVMKISVILETVYTHVLQPYPSQITQSEKQFVVFEGNHYFYSSYPIDTNYACEACLSKCGELYQVGEPHLI
ncbi:hypothetical protein QTO34_007700 [Cnephaeus nilssonii]|uniref:Dolichyl-diphosphooligosaccharide--protein glycosyltransferase subunit 1 n=1 Tax=Cnephaeus nilssonii TaxID=3371016 RepID=A0AA40HIX4_CNENI|nr:hypothetical protein QTO34_007700 [Eptesicus nilssonii]